jgi:adenylyltransferase/sulfurtransferase
VEAPVSVLVVGLGGLGAPVVRILLDAGVRAVTVVDPDVVAVENLHRQILFRDADVGRPKAAVAAERCGVEALAVRLDAANGPSLVAGRACVVDGTDSFADKYLLNDLCLDAGVPLVHAGAAGFRGQVLLVRRGGPCLRCLLPEPPDARRDECRQAGIFGPAAGVVGALAAGEVLRALGGAAGPSPLLLADLATGRISRARLDPLADCRCRVPGTRPAC